MKRVSDFFTGGEGYKIIRDKEITFVEDGNFTIGNKSGVSVLYIKGANEKDLHTLINDIWLHIPSIYVDMKQVIDMRNKNYWSGYEHIFVYLLTYLGEHANGIHDVISKIQKIANGSYTMIVGGIDDIPKEDALSCIRTLESIVTLSSCHYSTAEHPPILVVTTKYTNIAPLNDAIKIVPINN